MPTEPVQLYLALFEFVLLVAGLFLLVAIARPERRIRWLRTNRLPLWPVTAAEFAIFVFLIFTTGFVLQTGLHLGLGKTLTGIPDREGIEIFVYGAGFSGGSILGWYFFQRMRKTWYADYGATPPVSAPAQNVPKLSSAQSIAYGTVTLLIAMPLVSAVSVGWAYLLRVLGLPEEPQPLVGIFANTKSPAVIGGMLFVACVLAPISEELLFRGGIFRFLRQRSGRFLALAVSGLLFGAMHGNWAGMLPLAVLGAILAISYEATGDIRVPIVAHALFNLNTVIVVLSGLSEIAS